MLSLGYVGEKWANDAKKRRHWNTQVNKEVMTCYIISNPSEMGNRKRIYDMKCARNPTVNVTEQRLIDRTMIISIR